MYNKYKKVNVKLDRVTRVNNMKAQSTQHSRKTVLDIYNENVRVQCSECNRGHQFEGI